jgi:hypothetical protein
MHANEAVDAVAAPLRGARYRLQIRTVFGRVAAFPVEDGGPAVRTVALAAIRRSSPGAWPATPPRFSAAAH